MQCKVQGCERAAHARGFCTRHYAQWSRHGLIDEEGRPLREPVRVGSWEGQTCRQEGCSEPARSRGWCNKHYLQFRNGILDEDGNEIRSPKFRPGRVWRSYCRGYRKVMAKEHPRADRDGYILEHRLVMEEHLGRYLEPEEVVHHINGVRDDNRIENLQLRSSRADHGHGHEQIDDVEYHLSSLEQLINYGMSRGAEFKDRLRRLAKRL